MRTNTKFPNENLSQSRHTGSLFVLADTSLMRQRAWFTKTGVCERAVGQSRSSSHSRRCAHPCPQCAPDTGKQAGGRKPQHGDGLQPGVALDLVGHPVVPRSLGAHCETAQHRPAASSPASPPTEDRRHPQDDYHDRRSHHLGRGLSFCQPAKTDAEAVGRLLELELKAAAEG